MTPPYHRYIRKAVIALALVALAAWLLPSFVGAERYRRRLEAGLERALKRPVTFGAVAFHLLPRPGFSIANAMVREDPAFGSEPFARVERIDCELRWRSLWRSRIDFARLYLDRPTFNVVRNAGGVAFVASKIPLPDDEQWLANIRKLVAELNGMGLTAWYDAGGRGVSAKHYERYRALAERGELDARAFWTTIRQPATPEQVDKVLAEIAEQKPFQGTDHLENIGWGESVYLPATTTLLRPGFDAKPEDMREVRRIAQAVAARGMMLNAHVEMTPAIDAYLEQYEAINKETPLKGLRWVFSHLDQVGEAQLERMKRLDIYAGLHSRPLIQGALMHKAHGERAWDMPPFRRVQASGIVWGLGSDATAVTPSNPFYTLAFAVTGRMIGGREVNRQTITREEALIAHTRSNAWFIFQESNLGSIQPGKYADLVVLDRDYLTVPAEQIKDIKPVMTMVGGKIVHQR